MKSLPGQDSYLWLVGLNGLRGIVWAFGFVQICGEGKMKIYICKIYIYCIVGVRRWRTTVMSQVNGHIARLFSYRSLNDKTLNPKPSTLNPLP